MKRKKYEPPELTVVQFQVEQGFYASSAFFLALFAANMSDGSTNLENREVGSTWGDEWNN